MLTLWIDVLNRVFMGNLVEIVDSLENRVSKLLHKMEILKQTNFKLNQELETLKNNKLALEQTAKDWEEKYNALKIASSILGSNENKTEAKLKINTLIREIDHCIAQLSE